MRTAGLPWLLLAVVHLVGVPGLLSAQPGAGRDLGTVADPGGVALRVAAIGDFGYRGPGSGLARVGAAIRSLHGEVPFHLGLTLGDNFYPDGVASPDDRHWRETWEPEFGPLRIPFFASLGNHDYQGRVQAEIDYTGRGSGTWRLPHRYYTFRAGPVQFFALDTDEGTAGRVLFTKAWSDAQARWLAEALGASQAPWKIVYGHHPIISDGEHGGERRLEKKLLPLLERHRVTAYLSGHEHDLQHHRSPAGVDLVVAGGGGAQARPVDRRRAVFAAGRHGFVELEATQRSFAIRWRSDSGALLHAQERRRDEDQ